MLIFLPGIFWIVKAKSSATTMHEQTKSLSMHSKRDSSRTCQKCDTHAAQAVVDADTRESWFQTRCFFVSDRRMPSSSFRATFPTRLPSTWKSQQVAKVGFFCLEKNFLGRKKENMCGETQAYDSPNSYLWL